MTTFMAQLVYALNALWFTAGFIQFCIAQDSTLKILVPREARANALAPTIKASMSFLGGINGALALFCFYLAIRSDLFAEPVERVSLLAFLGLVNLSQFSCNLPILARGGRQGVAYWNVLSGPMLVIFVVDGALTIIDVIAAVALS